MDNFYCKRKAKQIYYADGTNMNLFIVLPHYYAKMPKKGHAGALFQYDCITLLTKNIIFSDFRYSVLGSSVSPLIVVDKINFLST